MPTRHTLKHVGEFAIHTLRNEVLSISIAPTLGGRLVSLRDRVSGREWLDGWAPAAKRRIWQPTDPANYETGPGAGIDECLPTVLPCKLGRKALPDHGELWNQSPEFHLDPKGRFACRWTLKSLPLAFERHITLDKHEVRCEYRIENLADLPTPFLWAWHPLFTWKRGDEIRFAPAEKTCLTPDGEVLPWPLAQPGNDLSRAKFPKGSTPAAKVFLGPLSKGTAEIRANNGAGLSLSWPSALFPYAGIWITRGFWKGLHHWAIEPTNAPVDRLSGIPGGEAPSPTRLLPREVRKWTLKIEIAPARQTSKLGPIVVG